jgi:DNA polymerase III subunit beta
VKFTTTKEKLAASLAAISAASKQNHGMKITVDGTSAKVVAADDVLAIARTFTISDGEDGTAVIPYQTFQDMVSVSSGDVTVTITDGDGTISCDGAEFAFRTLASDRAPAATLPAGNAVTMPAADLLNALRQVIPAASTDTNRVALTGVLMHPFDGGLRLVATDSYRLAVREVAGVGIPDDKKALVPATTFRALVKVFAAEGDIAVRVSDKEIAFANADTVLVSRLLADAFPSYEPLLQIDVKQTLTFDADQVCRALERAEKVLKQAANLAVRFSVEHESSAVTVKTVAADSAAKSTFEASGATSDIEFNVNPRYMREMVAASGTKEFELLISEPLKPMLVRPSGSNEFKAMVMPLKV